LPFLSPYAQAEWRRLAPELTRLGMLSPLDHAVFAAYCAAFSLWRTALAELDRAAAADPETKGLVVEGDKSLVMNPLLRVGSKCAADLLMAARELGMTPASRSPRGWGVRAAARRSKFDGLLR
jgi:P27 family predicted phage terminase small subunit